MPVVSNFICEVCRFRPENDPTITGILGCPGKSYILIKPKLNQAPYILIC